MGRKIKVWTQFHYTLVQCTPFSVPIFTKLTTARRRYKAIFYTEFHQKRPKSIEIELKMHWRKQVKYDRYRPIITKVKLAIPNFVKNLLSSLMKIRQTVQSPIWGHGRTWSPKQAFFCCCLTNVKKLQCCCQWSLLWRKLKLRYSIVTCSHGINLRILLLHNLVTRVLLSTVSAEILALMMNII